MENGTATNNWLYSVLLTNCKHDTFVKRWNLFCADKVMYKPIEDF